MNEKRLTAINLTIVFYFISIYLIDLFRIDFVLIDVFREILTIPFLLALIVFVILSINLWVKRKMLKPVTIFSIFLLAVIAIITIGSFFC